MNNQMTQAWNKLRYLAVIPLITLGLLSILASGGGGGGGDGGSGGGGGGGGTPESAATITTTNAATLISDVMGTSDPTGGIAAASTRQGTSRGQSVSSGRELAQRLETVYQATLGQTRITSQRFAPAISVDETDPCDFGQGTIHYTGNINSDGTGMLTATYTNCLLNGLTHNGQATLQVTAFSLTFLVPIDSTFTISSLTVTGPDIDETLSGSFRDQLNLGADTETMTFNLTTTDNVSGKAIKAHSLRFVFVYDDIFSPSSYTLTMTGRVWDSDYGYVDVLTVTPFVFANINQLFPDSGQIILTGAGNASIRVTALPSPLLALPSTLLTVELDLDGDSVYEVIATLKWTDLSGPIGADLGDEDMDGMHNSWETNYMLDPLDPSDAAFDRDGDGFSSFEEYQAGTDPNTLLSAPPGIVESDPIPPHVIFSGFGSSEVYRGQTFRLPPGLTVTANSLTVFVGPTNDSGANFRVLITEVDMTNGFHPTNVLFESETLNVPSSISRSPETFVIDLGGLVLESDRDYAWILDHFVVGTGAFVSMGTGLGDYPDGMTFRFVNGPFFPSGTREDHFASNNWFVEGDRGFAFQLEFTRSP